MAILRALMREGRSEIETMPVTTNTPSLLALSLVGNKLILHVTHLGMSSGFLPEPKLGPRFLLSLGLTIAQRLAYWSRFLALPIWSFLARSCFTTLGAWFLTLPLRAIATRSMAPRYLLEMAIRSAV